jgi:hypothetical protein
MSPKKSPQEMSQRVIRLPESARIPSDWITQEDLFGKESIIQPKSGKNQPKVHVDLATRVLSCTCKVFKRIGGCGHIISLIAQTSPMPEPPTDTKKASYYKFTGDEISDRQLAVLNCLKKYGPQSNRMIGKRLHRPINTITGRVWELRSMQLVTELGKSYDFKTARYVLVWQAVPWGEEDGK